MQNTSHIIHAILVVDFFLLFSSYFVFYPHTIYFLPYAYLTVSLETLFWLDSHSLYNKKSIY